MFLEPTSIAVIGASTEPQKLGHYILKNIVEQGFKGDIYPINPKAAEILGKKAYASVTDVKGDVDMALIVTPAATVIELAEECGKKKVKVLVVITAGFSELGTKEAVAEENELRMTAQKHGMRLIGPNCLGLLRPGIGLNASFAEAVPKNGNIALISQSGAMAVALMDMSAHLSMGYSLVVSIGNKADMDEAEFLTMCEQDTNTEVIGLYLESIKNGPAFMEVAARVAQTKPIVLIKSGVSKRGSQAVSSHTGALAGSDKSIDALCTQTGMHRAHNTEEFLDLLRTLSTQPPLLSSNIAIITNAGGPGVLATDAAEKEGLVLPALSEKIVEELTKKLPASASTKNPIDVIGDALSDRYIAAIDACGKDPNIDGIAVVLTPQVMTPSLDIAKAILKAKKSHPLMPMVTCFLGFEKVQEAHRYLCDNGMPNFESPEDAVAALKALRVQDDEMRKIGKGGKVGKGGADVERELVMVEDHDSAASTGAKQILKGKHGLLDDESRDVLFGLYKLPVPDQALANTENNAVEYAKEIGYPVIAKISSPDIIHKTDIGGVRANLKTEEEVRKAYQEILGNCKSHAPTAGIRGILMQKFLPAGHEFIIGSIKDPTFGPLIMVGLGGIYTELFKDTAFRIAPVTEQSAYDMLTELKGWKILTGLRGGKQSDIAALAKAIVKVSRLVLDNPEISELDLNPVLVYDDGIMVADAKVILG